MSDDRSSAEIEREIEEERHALARSLEDLQAQFSPERVMNQASTYLRSNGGELAENFVTQVKRNPVAAAMAGVGVAWLLMTSEEAAQGAGLRPPDRHTHDHALRRPGVDRVSNRSAYVETGGLETGGDPRGYATAGYVGTPTYDDRAYRDGAGQPVRSRMPAISSPASTLEDATSDDPSALGQGPA